MAITEAQATAVHYYATVLAQDNRYYCRADGLYDDPFDWVITTTTSEFDYIVFEPKEAVDWRGLEKCFTGFKSKYNLNKSIGFNIRQPVKCHRNKRRSFIHSLKKAA